MAHFFAHRINLLRKMVVTQKVRATEICQYALAQVDDRNLHLHALTNVLASSAMAEARSIDNDVSGGRPVGLLAGIPIVIKDNIDTVPAACSSGLPFLADFKPQKDATVVKLLRSEGALIIGVGATDNGAFGVTTDNVVNPDYATKIAGGSSGGPAAAVATGFCKAAIGTDTGGSIRIPAACCGIVGFKPTYGRVSTEGVRPLAPSYDHVGPLARCVADIRSVMDVIDPNFRSSVDSHQEHMPIIGIPKSYFADASAEVMTIMAEAVKRLKHLGYGLREIQMPAPDEVLPVHMALSLGEAVALHSARDDRNFDDYPTVARKSLVLGRSYTQDDIENAIKKRLKIMADINQAFDQIDFIVLPTLPVLAPDRGSSKVLINGVKIDILLALIRYTAAFDQTGHPAIALPWHTKNCAAISSLQIVGPLNGDSRLLDFAERIEMQSGLIP